MTMLDSLMEVADTLIDWFFFFEYDSDSDEYLGLREAALYLGVSVDTVYDGCNLAGGGLLWDSEPCFC